jgi:hypothetical protein
VPEFKKYECALTVFVEDKNKINSYELGSRLMLDINSGQI